MKQIKIVILGLAASCLFVSGASAQGLIGQPYFGFDGGWERLENGVSDDGWGVGAEFNMPMNMNADGQFGADFLGRFDYADVLDRDILNAKGLIRGYMAGQQGVRPFIGAGFGWVDFDSVDSTYAPVEAGVEFAAGPMAVAPFFRYSFAFDSAVEDFWEAGATAVYWVDQVWGLTASVTYTDYDDIGGLGAIDSGIGARLGVVFSF